MTANELMWVVLLGAFAPTITAHVRKHRNRLAIDMCNFLAIVIGLLSLMIAPLALMTFPQVALVGAVCWIVAQVWACTVPYR